jgi:hypothetical protein
MYNVRLLGIVTMSPPVQRIYPNKNEDKQKKNAVKKEERDGVGVGGRCVPQKWQL